MRDKTLYAAVAVACLLPILAYASGLEVGSERAEFSPAGYEAASPLDRREAPFVIVRGELIHSLLEWTGVCAAFATALLSMVHYFLKKDVTTPVIATALAFAGVLDGMRVYTLLRLAGPVEDPELFAAITWGASRVFLASILIAGTAPYLFRKKRKRPPKRDAVDYVLLAVLYLLAAGTLIYYAREKLVLPRESAVVTQLEWTLNLCGLFLFVACSGVLSVYARRTPSLFSSALLASMIPHVAAQACLLALSGRLYDAGFNLASAYKLVAYLVPMVGLVLDYRRASRADAELKTTERQLHIARDIQQSLLPTGPADWADLDAAGFSESSEAVGGDYFDFITLPDGARLVLIADVSGHDLGAALLMANGRAYLRAMAEDASDVRTIARRYNAFVGRDARGRRFVTGMLCKIDAAGRTEIVAAGHSGYLVRPDGSYATLEQENVPFGVLDEFEAEPLVLELKPGETLTLLTDGLQELPDPKGEQFGLDRTAAAVAAHARGECETSLADVRRAADAWAGGVDAFDDMTVVLVRRRAEDASPGGPAKTPKSRKRRRGRR